MMRAQQMNESSMLMMSVYEKKSKKKPQRYSSSVRAVNVGRTVLVLEISSYCTMYWQDRYEYQ